VECPQYSTGFEALAYLYVSSNTLSPALRPTSVPSAWHFDPCSHLATIDTGRNLGDCCASYEGELGSQFSHLTQCGLGRHVPPTKWHLDPSSRLTTIGMGQKVGAAVPWLPVLIWTVINLTVIANPNPNPNLNTNNNNNQGRN